MTNFERTLRRAYTAKFLTIYLLVMIFSYFFVDRTIATYMANFPHIYKHIVIQSITFLGLGWIYLIALPIVNLVFAFLKKQNIAHKLLYVWVAICTSGVIVNILKISLSRVRPYLYLDKGYYGFFWWHGGSDYWSFPSGHASMIFTFSLACSLVFQRYRYLFLCYGFIVALSRVVVLAHFLSDIMAAFLLSIFVVLVVLDKLKTIKHFNSDLVLTS